MKYLTPTFLKTIMPSLGHLQNRIGASSTCRRFPNSISSASIVQDSSMRSMLLKEFSMLTEVSNDLVHSTTDAL